MKLLPHLSAGVADAPEPAVDGSSCECSCAAEPDAALAPGQSITSTGTAVALAPIEAGPPDGMGAEDAKIPADVMSPADDMAIMAPAPATSRKVPSCPCLRALHKHVPATSIDRT